MLTDLQIRQFLIIESLDLGFKEGMTVVTGETGAGKSILLDALQFVAGARADSKWVRQGASEAAVIAQFGDLVLKRVMNNDGRSRAYINGELVSVTELKTLGETLIHWVGQYEHQRLLKNEVQLAVLDAYAKNGEFVNKVAQLSENITDLQAKLDQLQEDSNKQEEATAFKKFQLEVLNDLALKEGEWEALHIEHKKLSLGSELVSAITSMLSRLHEEENNLIAAMKRIEKETNQLATEFKELQNSAKLSADATVHMTETYYELKSFYDRLELDPERLATVEARLAEVHATARKLQLQVESLFSHQQALEAELASLGSVDEQIQACTAALVQEQNLYLQAAEALSARRLSAAQELSLYVTQEMRTLGMKEGEFAVSLSISAKAGISHFPKMGLDQIEFRVRMNPGQKWGLLKEAASGGELSRIALIISVLNAKQNEASTLIFDEVDVGVSGAVASKVGTLLRALSVNTQVLCITHLPQVAMLGDQHIHVNKTFQNGQTFGQASTLTLNERIEEVARMMSGENITDQARQLASAELMNMMAVRGKTVFRKNV